MVFLLFFGLLNRLLITEVHPNPTGSESGEAGDRFEFVEIYNNSNMPINLLGFRISDTREVDEIIPFSDSSILNFFPQVIINSTVLLPGNYALIVDPEITMDLNNPPDYFIKEHTLILRPHDTDIGNGLANTDCILLISPTYDTMATYGTPNNEDDEIPLPPPDGYSIELRDYTQGDIHGNWRISRWKSSPGMLNSWSLENNLTLVRDSVKVLPTQILPWDTVTVSFFVLNTGLGVSDSVFFSYFSEGNEERRVFHETLPPDNGVWLSIFITYPTEGVKPLKIELATDLDTSDNSIFLYLYVGKPPIVINEIMYWSDFEWIEIYNRWHEPINLRGVTVRDSAGRTSSPIPDYLLNPGEYLVITGSPGFSSLYPTVPHIVIGRFPVLNNSYETIYLVDSLGSLLDRVFYRSSYGGGRNISLERVSPELPSSLVANWGSSVDPTGSTPGRQNSIFVDVKLEFPHEFHIILDPPIPKTGDRAILVFKIPENYLPSPRLRVLIFNLQGKLVGKIFEGKWENPISHGEFLFFSPQTPGGYIIYFELRKEGLKPLTKRVPFTVKP